ncbi:MAG: porin [Cyclobacteriaceae bacterium]|nr:porin [Cyclobacteriaceae bacterium]
MKSYLTLVFFLFFFANDKIYSQNQNDSIADDNPVFRFIGFIDVFYAYDFNKPVSNFRQSFLYNHNRHNEFAINLGLISLKVEQNKYRANFGLQGGTYTVDNYTGGNSDFRFIHEANVGVLLSNKYPIWLDAGIFSSHIGFESAISMENLTLSRSLVAENSPYFLSGLKVAYQTDPLNLSLILANGWQRIARIEGNSLVSIGTQVTFQTQKNFQLTGVRF